MNKTDINLCETRIREVVRQHEGGLVRFAANITHDLDMARDIAQDTFLKWIESMRSSSMTCCPEDSKLKAWLFTVCRNKAVDVLRKEKKMNHLTDASIHQSDTSTPLATVVKKEEEGMIVAILENLPPHYQEIVRLKYQNNFTYREISEITGHSISHVGVIIHKSVEKLRDNFRQSSGERPVEHGRKREVGNES